MTPLTALECGGRACVLRTEPMLRRARPTTPGGSHEQARTAFSAQQQRRRRIRSAVSSACKPSQTVQRSMHCCRQWRPVSSAARPADGLEQLLAGLAGGGPRPTPRIPRSCPSLAIDAGNGILRADLRQQGRESRGGGAGVGQTGIGPEILKAMLPMVSTMVMSALAKGAFAGGVLRPASRTRGRPLRRRDPRHAHAHARLHKDGS